MKIASWNINGIKARHDRLLAYLDRASPDVLCLQEIKSEDTLFPGDGIRERGYELHTFGQKAYNGVALLSKRPMSDVTRGFGDGDEDPQARFLSAVVDGLRIASVYVPNGDSVGSEKFAYKLRFLERFTSYVQRRAKGGSLIVGGDYNIAPEDRDVHDPAAWHEQVLCSSAERAALKRLCDAGVVDALRALDRDRVAFTWWDYRMLGFQKNRGLRIDHFLVTPDIAARLDAFDVDRNERKGQQPSDHAPVSITLR